MREALPCLFWDGDPSNSWIGSFPIDWKYETRFIPSSFESVMSIHTHSHWPMFSSWTGAFPRLLCPLDFRVFFKASLVIGVSINIRVNRDYLPVSIIGVGLGEVNPMASDLSMKPVK
jgi:hypothetical protein